MPSFYCPGPIDHFVTFRNNVTYYLGTAVTAPEIEVRPGKLQVMNDVGGRTFPVQKVRDRIQHVVSTTLNRLDWSTWKLIEGATPVNGPGTLIDNNLTHGGLELGVDDFELTLVYSLGGTAINPSDFPVGRRYYSATLVGARESTVGTRVEEVAMVFECNELFVPSSRTFRLYTELASAVTTGLPAVT